MSPNHKQTPRIRPRGPCSAACDKVFNRRSQLRTHLFAHAGEKRYACEMCGRKYREKHNLVIHSRTHTGERPFECSSCPAAFTSSGDRKKHMLTHTGERPHECNVCGKRFSTKSNLASHALTHSGKKAFACHACGRKFSHSHTLRRHARTHSGEKPYACHLCPATFALLSTLKGHVASHTGERPYRCNVFPASSVAGKLASEFVGVGAFSRQLAFHCACANPRRSASTEFEIIPTCRSYRRAEQRLSDRQKMGERPPTREASSSHGVTRGSAVISRYRCGNCAAIESSLCVKKARVLSFLSAIERKKTSATDATAFPPSPLAKNGTALARRGRRALKTTACVDRDGSRSAAMMFLLLFRLMHPPRARPCPRDAETPTENSLGGRQFRTNLKTTTLAKPTRKYLLSRVSNCTRVCTCVRRNKMEGKSGRKWLKNFLPEAPEPEVGVVLEQ
ncbi:hypothetical protein HPB52_015047 [Rhipicephalus sanguineus]|uniref:C2H2-type domain-containing protein n=1 Tax=Rhipicephalus sanguineus TaxID=34632 RepID=A0A9D4SYJ9_RHISA|nr:hypothetical protein HPB52_015047 [Rhipicephalus sanguineus]